MANTVREAANAFRRAPMLTGLSAGMIALSLFLVGLFGLVAYNLQIVIRYVEARVEVVAYLYDDAEPGHVSTARTDIMKYAEVRDVRYVTRAQALASARADLPELGPMFGFIEDNPFPASLEIALHPNQKGPEAVKAVADRIRLYPFVEDVQYGDAWLGTVYLLRQAAGVATLVLGSAFALVAALIIGAVVRISIFARRDEIEIMRLVGATEGYIRKPFLLEGLATGLIGGVLALGATWGVYRLLSGSLFPLEWMPDHWIGAGIAAGAILGCLASAVAVRQHLKAIY